MMRSSNPSQNQKSLRRVLIIYTGGTIGMKQGPNGYSPVSGWMEQQLVSMYAFQDPLQPPRTTPCSKEGLRIYYDIIEYEPLLDSANMEVQHWVQIAREIERYYEQYDGFVVLHGTDTMSYTASALSFMLVNLQKTVVLTGSQIPLSEVRNDAVGNVLGALTMAGLSRIPEVCLYFDNQLFRGNRTQKIDASGLGAFASNNFPPLAKVGVGIDVAWHLVQPMPVRPLRLREIHEQHVASVRLYPGIRTEILKRMLQAPLKGLVLETYGAGNVPTTRQDLLDVLREAIDRGVVIVNCTQCLKGSVSSAYETGSILKQLGVCSAQDMTPEAALTKLAYLLSQPDVSIEQVPKWMEQSLRGELTEPIETKKLFFPERRFVESVTQVLSKGEDLGMSEDITKAMYPILSCSAASRGDVEALERMLRSRFDLNRGDYDGRTPLHLAAAEGQEEVVRFLLDHGADVNVVDRWGVEPIVDALDNHRENIIPLLLEAGGRVNAPQVIGRVLELVQKGDLMQVKRWVRCGADLSLSGLDGRTPLHLAAGNGDVEMVEFLLDCGVDVHRRDRFGARAIDDALRLGYEAVVARISWVQVKT